MRYALRVTMILTALALLTAGTGCGAESVPQQAEGIPLVQQAPESPADGAAAAEPSDQAGEAAPAETSDPSAGDTDVNAAAEQEKARIAQAQQMLIDLGYLSGGADGLYGPMTAAALTRFQGEHDLEATGTLDDATMQALSGLAARAGDTRMLQQRLIDLGYLRGRADGNFGERSQTALKQFQAVQGLEVTGTPDDATREALFSPDARSLPKWLGVGSKGDGVVALQEALIRYGFLFGEADGGYGAKTSAAVKRFQKHLEAQGKAEALGIQPTGEATAVTQMMLFDPDWSSYLTDVRPGDEGDEVMRIERRLARLGYMDAEPDDVLDDYAVSAAQAFREAAGIEGDAFDKTFIDALFSADAPAAEHFVLHAIAIGDKGVAVQEVQEALVRGGMTVSMPDGDYGKGLAGDIGQLHDYLAGMGSTRAFLYENPEFLSVEAQQLLKDDLLGDLPGVFVATDKAMTCRVQRRLNSLYFLSRRRIDGVFGEETQQALCQFQAANGLPETGLADTATLNRLFSADASCKLLPYRVEVSIDDQRVYVYELQASGEYELIHTFLCSTGLGNSTPRGIFLDGGPVNVWHHFSKFNVWARYSYEIDGDIMFHSVLYSEKNTDTLRENSLYGLGHKASHGCVRLAVKSAKWIYEHCSKGSTVIIIY